MKKHLSKFLLSAVLCTWGVAHAGDRHAPLSITKTHAFVTLPAPTIAPVATCQGSDATYTLLHVTGEGPITSEDQRLAGTFIVDAYILDNPNTGVGISTDNFRIVDPSTGSLKWKGTAWAVDQDPAQIKSLASGELVDGTRFLTLATVTLPAPGASGPLTIEYGGAGALDHADRAILISGDCGELMKHFGFR